MIGYSLSMKDVKCSGFSVEHDIVLISMDVFDSPLSSVVTSAGIDMVLVTLQ